MTDQPPTSSREEMMEFADTRPDLPPVRFTTTAAECQEMHAWFNKATRQAVRWNANAARSWFDALVRFSSAELYRVLVHVTDQVKKGGHPGMLRLGNFLALDTLEQRLQTLDASRRLGKVAKPPTMGQKALQEFRGYQEPPQERTPQPIRTALADGLRDLAAQLGTGTKATGDSAPDCSRPVGSREGMDISTDAGRSAGKMDI